MPCLWTKQEEENGADLPAPTLDEHDCFELMKVETAHLPSVLYALIPMPQLTLYVDGSRFRYGVTEVIESDQGPGYHINVSHALPPSE